MGIIHRSEYTIMEWAERANFDIEKLFIRMNKKSSKNAANHGSIMQRMSVISNEMLVMRILMYFRRSVFIVILYLSKNNITISVFLTLLFI